MLVLQLYWKLRRLRLTLCLMRILILVILLVFRLELIVRRQIWHNTSIVEQRNVVLRHVILVIVWNQRLRRGVVRKAITLI